MVYISADGSIGSRKKWSSPFRLLIPRVLAKLRPEWQAVAVFAVAFVASRCWPSANPLAGGAIPAAEKMPHEHWTTISMNTLFVRIMTEHLGITNKREARATLEAEWNSNLLKEIELVDFGGPDGHVAEEVDWRDLESIRVTRCKTSQSAITAYFCGAAVAGNQDVALGNERKGVDGGVESFADIISCRHQQGERIGYHRRSVYRLSIGCEDNMAGYSHAFSIIAQPDGSFFWLQSFIGHYSLANWMEKVDASGTPHGHLSLADVQTKLKQVRRLMQISGWSSQANTDYLNLFGVDKEKEALSKGKPSVSLVWKPTDRLDYFYWDEACEYPLPPHEAGDEDKGTKPHMLDDYDECYIAHGRKLLEELFSEDDVLRGRDSD